MIQARSNHCCISCRSSEGQTMILSFCFPHCHTYLRDSTPVYMLIRVAVAILTPDMHSHGLRAVMVCSGLVLSTAGGDATRGAQVSRLSGHRAQAGWQGGCGWASYARGPQQSRRQAAACTSPACRCVMHDHCRCMHTVLRSDQQGLNLGARLPDQAAMPVKVHRDDRTWAANGNGGQRALQS